MSKRQTLQTLEYGFTQFSILLVCLSFAFISSGILNTLIKPSNPDEILNIYSPGGFSPEQNYAKIVWVIVFSLAFYKALSYLASRRVRTFKLVVVALVMFCVLSIDVLPRLGNYVGNLDAFHNGEQLSPSNDFNAGKGLYSGMFVLHGAGEDVIVPSLALRLSHKGETSTGIGTYYLLTTLLELVSAAAFVLLLALLFKNTALFLGVTIWFVLSAYSSFSYVRDIFTWGLLTLIYYLLFAKNSPYKRAAYFGVGSVSSLALFYAIDRGIIAIFLAGLIALVSLAAVPANSGFLSLRVPRKFADFYDAGLVAGGIVSVQVLGALLVGFSQYKDFLLTYFVQIPKYQGLLFNYPLPRLGADSWVLWLPIILIPFAAIMLYKLLRNGIGHRTFATHAIFAGILVAAGVLFLRIGYGRPDAGHIAYSTPLLFVGIFYTCVLYIDRYYPERDSWWLPAAVLVLLFIPVSSIQFDRFTAMMDVTPRQLKAYAALPSTPDQKWLPKDVAHVSSFLKNNTTPSDPIFVFTQQPIYYYLTDRRNPTRFYIPWFADPKPLERELLTSLQKDNPKYIVYSAGNGWDHIDGFSMRQRTPTVDAWLKQNYTTKTKIDTVLVLSKSTATNHKN